MKRLGYQLLLSVLLIVIACICFLYLLKVIFRQQKIERLRQDFVNAMVHEFKRPISNAGSMMDLIPFYLERKEMDKVGSYVDGCIMEFKKLTAYTDRIQRISNNDPERILLDRTDVPIVHFFANLKEKYVMRKDKTVNLEMSINTTRTTLNVDVLHFSNVMENLMENAIKYSNDPVDIEISVLDVENGIGIYVKDNGYGISDRDKKFIFDKFYRVNAAETKKQVGFGLGLTYVKSIVEAHGGVVRVTDNPHGTGSIFAVLLPF